MLDSTKSQQTSTSLHHLSPFQSGKTMHSITALICSNHLRSSFAMSEPTIDAATHFCASCEAYQALCEEVEASRRAWQDLEGPAKTPAAPYSVRIAYKEALVHCRKATSIWAMDRVLQEDNDDPEKPTLDVNGQPAHADEDENSSSVKTTRGLKARFAHSAQDRSEGEYCRPSEFNRKKYRYRPGRYADCSELRQRFWNTNDPERDRWYAENTGTSFWDASNTKLEDARPGGGDSVRNEGEGLDDPLPPLPKPEENEEKQLLNDSSCEAERGREDDDEDDDESKEEVDLPVEGAWDFSSDFYGGDDEALGIEHGAAADSDGQGSERDSGDEAEAGRPEARGNDQADQGDDAAAP